MDDAPCILDDSVDSFHELRVGPGGVITGEHYLQVVLPGVLGSVNCSLDYLVGGIFSLYFK